MVNVAQLVEHQIVALVVVGSIPTIHPMLHLRGLRFEEYLRLRLAQPPLKE